MPLTAGAQQAPSTMQQPAGGSARLYRHWSKLLSNLNLSSQQHSQIQGLLDQYAQSHPAGSQFDRPAVRNLRNQIFAVLTADQQAQLRQQMHAQRIQQLQRRLQRLEQQQGAPAPAATPY